MTELDPKLTFDSFVVGPANRLAAAAARRAAESPGKSYNPLFLYAESGLGKSHLLSAVAHQVRRQNPKLEVRYQALEEYLDELARALEAGERDQLRKGYRDLDLLLLDDVQFLAGQPEAQEMLLSTLDALTHSGSQVVLASDRPPSEINSLDARLMSRFTGGLIVDIGPPEYETRVAIIRRRVDRRGQELQPGVAEGLARYRFKNVRELGGALNRILAIQDLEGRSVSAEEVARIMGDETGASGPAFDPTFDAFLKEISESLAVTVDIREEPWRREVREVAQEAEQGGYRVARLRALLEEEEEPEDWQASVEAFRGDVKRLREIDRELDRLGNPWPEAAEGTLHDPDRLEEAEALLASVRERTRPFVELAPGATLGNLEEHLPPLILKAVEQLVGVEKPQYNPLFLWSPDPVVPRAVMAAAGRTYRTLSPEARIAVVSVPEFAEDFIRALSAGVAGAWRERWWTVDLLLVHEAQALSGTERAQDEFFHLFEALKRRGARVLIVSDRPPAGVERINERLRSRFEGGLVLELEGVDLPADTLELRLLDPGARDRTAGGAEEGEALTPSAVPVASWTGEGSEPLRTVGATAGASGGRWIPSRERVVWFWPELRDRLVEDLE